MSIVDTTTQPLMILDAQAKVVSVNKAFELMFKVQRSKCLNEVFLKSVVGSGMCRFCVI